MSKVCKDCNERKPLQDFTVRPRNKDGYDVRCKVCRTIKYNKSSLERVIKKRYGTQLLNSEKRGHPPPSYTLEELIDWVRNNPLWPKLYEDWKQSKYSKNLAPSIDRIDLNKPYTMDNIELMTWKQNQQNHADDAYTGHEKARLRPVNAYTKDGKLHKEYYSIAVAVRELNGHYWGISSVADGVPIKDGKGKYYTPRTYKGFIWRWADQSARE